MKLRQWGRKKGHWGEKEQEVHFSSHCPDWESSFNINELLAWAQMQVDALCLQGHWSSEFTRTGRPVWFFGGNEESNERPGLKATGAAGVIRLMRHGCLVCLKMSSSLNVRLSTHISHMSEDRLLKACLCVLLWLIIYKNKSRKFLSTLDTPALNSC